MPAHCGVSNNGIHGPEIGDIGVIVPNVNIKFSIQVLNALPNSIASLESVPNSILVAFNDIVSLASIAIEVSDESPMPFFAKAIISF